MSNSEHKEILLDKDSFVKAVRIPISEVSRLIGVTPRQLRYWTKEGYISSRTNEHYNYGFRDLQKINLMAQFMAKGESLESAEESAEQALTEVEEQGSKTSESEAGESVFRTWAGITRDEIQKEARKIARECLEDPDFKKTLIKELIDRVSERNQV